jgi:DnaK suppressor protein
MRAELKTDQADSPQVLREMLIRLQVETLQRINAFRRDQEQESASEPGDEMDSASATAEIETHAGLIAREEEKLKYLDEALARLDADHYGRCVACGRPIPLERLRVLPFASNCVDCQAKRGRSGRDWGEGGTIEPYDHQWTVPEEMEEPTERENQGKAPEDELAIHYREPLGRAEPGNQAKRSASAEKRTRRRKS